MNTAPNAHIAVLLVHLRDIVELPLYVRIEQIVAVNGMTGLGPNTHSRTPTAVPEMIAACDGYSGCIGVSLNEVHPASRSVASLPSWSPLRIAVTGRQKL